MSENKSNVIATIISGVVGGIIISSTFFFFKEDIIKLYIKEEVQKDLENSIDKKIEKYVDENVKKLVIDKLEKIVNSKMSIIEKNIEVTKSNNILIKETMNKTNDKFHERLSELDDSISQLNSDIKYYHIPYEVKEDNNEYKVHITKIETMQKTLSLLINERKTISENFYKKQL